MKTHAWDHQRGFFAVVCGTILFGLLLVPGFAQGPPDEFGWFVCALFYVVFSALVYWLFARRPAANRPVSARRTLKRFGPFLTAGAALIAGPVVSIGFWALDVYVVSAEYYLTPYERKEALPAFVTIGVFVGVVVSALVAAIKRE